MSVSIEQKVGALAAQHPAATRVFARHGIDFCCGGGRPLREVCLAKGLDAATVAEEIRGEVEGRADADVDWNRAPLTELIRHIVQGYHRALDEELPRLEAMARKVHRVHGDKDPERLAELLAVYLGLEAELRLHMI